MVEANNKPVPNYTTYEVGMKIPQLTSEDFSFEFLTKAQKRILGTLEEGAFRDALIERCKGIAECVEAKKIFGRLDYENY